MAFRLLDRTLQLEETIMRKKLVYVKSDADFQMVLKEEGASQDDLILAWARQRLGHEIIGGTGSFPKPTFEQAHRLAQRLEIELSWILSIWELTKVDGMSHDEIYSRVDLPVLYMFRDFYIVYDALYVLSSTRDEEERAGSLCSVLNELGSAPAYRPFLCSPALGTLLRGVEMFADWIDGLAAAEHA